jgi:hypothetical protein
MNVRTPVTPEENMSNNAELYIRENLRPDLRALLGPVEETKESKSMLLDDPGPLLTKFSSCKESSTDGKEDTKDKELGKSDDGKGAAASPSGPVRDNKAQESSVTTNSLAESAHANAFV